jgi:general secretion pathway protein J
MTRRASRLPSSFGASRGFTLIEVLMAVAIFVVVGVLAMGGYNELVKQSEHLGKSAARTRAIQSTMQRLAQDFASLEPRPVREPLGDGLQPALRADDRTQELVHFTRSGWTNPAGVSRSTLQRVAYRLDDKKLRRDYWVMLDRTLSVEPVSTVLLDDVNEVSFRFLDQNRNWHTQWPPVGYSAPDLARVRPIAVEITLDLEDWGKLVRLVEVSG